MKQGATGRRTRGRSNGGRKQVPLKMQHFDSNGPDVRVRGTANQVYEKYLALARDANANGDRITAESYYQHAEHYFRILNDSSDPQPERPRGGDGQRPSRAQRRDQYEHAEREDGDGGGDAGDAEGEAASDDAAGGKRRAGARGRRRSTNGRGSRERREAADGADDDGDTGAGDGAGDAADSAGESGDAGEDEEASVEHTGPTRKGGGETAPGADVSDS